MTTYTLAVPVDSNYKNPTIQVTLPKPNVEKILTELCNCYGDTEFVNERRGIFGFGGATINYPGEDREITRDYAIKCASLLEEGNIESVLKIIKKH